MLTKEQINEILEDKEINFLLKDLIDVKQTEEDIKITLTIKKGKISKKEYTVRKFNNKNRAR